MARGDREKRCVLRSHLLFVLEPMVAKSILPTLGGTPMAWNTRLRGTEVVDLVEAEAAARVVARGFATRSYCLACSLDLALGINKNRGHGRNSTRSNPAVAFPS